VIAAKRNLAFSWWFSRVARDRIYRTFGRVWIEGVENLTVPNGESLMMIANHLSWWDPLVAIWLTNLVAPCESYAMMNAANLKRPEILGQVAEAAQQGAMDLPTGRRTPKLCTPAVSQRQSGNRSNGQGANRANRDRICVWRTRVAGPLHLMRQGSGTGDDKIVDEGRSHYPT
jgi:hypothetical protein